MELEMWKKLNSEPRTTLKNQNHRKNRPIKTRLHVWQNYIALESGDYGGTESILIGLLKIFVKFVLKNPLYLIYLKHTTPDSLFYFTILFFNIFLLFYFHLFIFFTTPKIPTFFIFLLPLLLLHCIFSPPPFFFFFPPTYHIFSLSFFFLVFPHHPSTLLPFFFFSPTRHTSPSHFLSFSHFLFSHLC